MAHVRAKKWGGHGCPCRPYAAALAPDPVEKELEELEKITCPFCQKQFCDPKILPCLHCYCKECVRQLVLQTGSNRPFKCPECGRGTILPQDDPDQLPTAFFINRVKELRTKMEKAQGKVEVMCGMCSRAKSEAFCHQCAEEFICSDCSRTATVKILFAAEVGVTVTMAACGKNVSVVKKGALWDNTNTSRRALKVK